MRAPTSMAQWAVDERTRLNLDVTKFIEYYNDVEPVFYSVSVRHTNYDSYSAYCYDLHDYLGNHKTKDDVEQAVRDYIDANLTMNELSSGRWEAYNSYGHRFDVKRVGADEAAQLHSKLTEELATLTKLRG